LQSFPRASLINVNLSAPFLPIPSLHTTTVTRRTHAPRLSNFVFTPKETEELAQLPESKKKPPATIKTPKLATESSQRECPAHCAQNRSPETKNKKPERNRSTQKLKATQD
jgi:hypothetical protein